MAPSIPPDPTNQMHAGDAQRRGGDGVAQPVGVFGKSFHRDHRRERVKSPPKPRPQDSKCRRSGKGQRSMTGRKTQVLGVKCTVESASERGEGKRLGKVVVQLEWTRATDDPFDRAVRAGNCGCEDHKDRRFEMLTMKPSGDDRDDDGEPV